MRLISKNNFGIEFESISKNYCKLRLKFDANIIGTLDDETYIPSFISSLDRLLKDNYYYEETISDVNFKEFLFLNDQVSDLYRVTLEDTFDDFIKRAVRNENKIYFYFCLVNEPFFSYEMEDGESFFSIVNIKDFEWVLDNFKSEIFK